MERSIEVSAVGGWQSTGGGCKQRGLSCNNHILINMNGLEGEKAGRCREVVGSRGFIFNERKTRKK